MAAVDRQVLIVRIWMIKIPKDGGYMQEMWPA